MAIKAVSKKYQAELRNLDILHNFVYIFMKKKPLNDKGID